jgi:hypothetical protein
MYTYAIRSVIRITEEGLRKDINRQSLELTAGATDGQIDCTPGYCYRSSGLHWSELIAEQTFFR